MKRTERGAYALIYLLAALPLIMVVGMISTKLLVRSLRAQQLATYEAQNNTELARLVRHIQEDAELAERVSALDAGLRFKQSACTIDYAIDANAVTRTVVREESPAEITTYKLHNGQAALSIEDIEDGGQLAWLRVVATYEISRAQSREWSFAAAALVGQGVTP